MKIQIFGAGGMLGNELIKQYPNFEFIDKKLNQWTSA